MLVFGFSLGSWVGWDALMMGIKIQDGYKLGLVLKVEGLHYSQLCTTHDC